MDAERPAAPASDRPAAPGPLRRLRARAASWRVPVALRMAAVVAAVTSAAMALLAAVVVQGQQRVLEAQTARLGGALAAQLALAAREPLLAGDVLALEVLAAGSGARAPVLGAAIYGPDGRRLAGRGEDPFLAGGAPAPAPAAAPPSFRWRTPAGDAATVFVAPVRHRDLLAGHAVVTLSRAPLERAVGDAVRTVLAAVAIVLALALAASLVAGRRLSAPILRLLDASRAIGEGRRPERLPERRNDELGSLMAAFNEMADGLIRKRQVEEVFSRFVSPSVAREILGRVDRVELGGRRVVASVLFADIVDFTGLAESLPPESVAALLNEYLALAPRAAAAFGGTVDKFIGDCAMVVFGVPEPDPDHAFHAVAAGVLFLRLVEARSRARAARGEPTVRFRVAVNTGPMLAGTLGSRERMEYTVVGDTVNLAARLSGVGEPGAIVLSEETWSEPGVRARVRAIRGRPIRVRGKRRPVATYTVTGLRPEGEALLAEARRALRPEAE